MPRSTQKARAREQRARAFAAVAGLPLRFLVEAVAERMGVRDGTITLHIRDGFVTSVDKEDVVFARDHPRRADTLDHANRLG